MPAAAEDMHTKIRKYTKEAFRNNRMLPIRHESYIMVS